MRLKDQFGETLLEEWALRFPPADVTLCNSRTGERTREISLVAVKVRTEKTQGKDLRTGEEKTVVRTLAQRYLAAGTAALAYEDAPDAAVFSPFRRGQIANYGAAEYLFKEFLKRLSPGLHLLKPILCIHEQERTTEVEERALTEAGMQAGARKVFLYQEPLSIFLESAPLYKELRGGLVIHLDPREEA